MLFDWLVDNPKNPSANRAAWQEVSFARVALPSRQGVHIGFCGLRGDTNLAPDLQQTQKTGSVSKAFPLGTAWPVPLERGELIRRLFSLERFGHGTDQANKQNLDSGPPISFPERGAARTGARGESLRPRAGCVVG